MKRAAGHISRRGDEKVKIIATRFDDVLFARISRIAQQRKVSFANVVRELVVKGLNSK